MDKNEELPKIVSEDALDRDLELPAFPLSSNGKESPDSAEPIADAITLSLQDLLPDSEGDVVLENSLGSLIILEGAEVAEQGILQDAHVTDSGQDVSGMAYARFMDGTTLYYDPENTVEFA